MIVAVSTFFEELSEYHPKLIMGQVSTIQYFRPVYHGIENGFSTENLYVGTVSQLPDEPAASPCCYMLLENVPLPEAYEKAEKNTYILIPKENSTQDLYDVASGIFENQVMVGLLSADLLQMVKAKADPDLLLKHGYETLKTPLVLIDRFLNVLGSVGTEQEELSVSFLQTMFCEKNQVKNGAADGYITYEMASQKHYYIAGRLMQGDFPMAYLVGTFNGSRVNDRNKKLFQVLCNFMELRMQNDMLYRQESYVSGNAFLYDLLNGKYKDAEEINRKKELLGLRFYDYLFVMILEGERGKCTEDQLHLLHFQLNSILGSYYWFTRDGKLVLLQDSRTKEPFSETESEKLEHFLAGCRMRAIVSQAFSDLGEFLAVYDQTDRGMEVLKYKKSPGHVILYEDLMIDHMLLKCSETMNLKRMVPDWIWQLNESDERKNQELTDTLFAYVQHGLNMTEAAQVLHIHYNTLKYRLGRIEEITGIDFTSSDELLKVLLAKHIFELNKIK